MLNSTMISQEKFTPSFENVKNIVQIVSNFTKLFNGHLEQKNISMQVNPDIKGPTTLIEQMARRGILVDVSLYEQILYNIVLNACKFNKNNGDIRIRFEVEKWQDQKAIVKTIISDSGIGIEKQKQKHLFKMFESVHSPIQYNAF